MRTRLLFLSLLVVAVFAMPALAQNTPVQPGPAMISQPVMPILAEPFLLAKKVATPEFGEQVTVMETDGRRWARVQYGDAEGWIEMKWLVNVHGPSPVFRGDHQMVYDSESDRIILYGGYMPFNTLLELDEVYLTDTWAYDVNSNTWTQMAPAQTPPSGDGTLAYDAQSDRVIWYLGDYFPSARGEGRETWAYDYNTDTWIRMQPEASPRRLIGARMVYDGESDRIILFGGFDPTNLTGFNWEYVAETWAYDYDSDTWTQMAPALSPPGMPFHTMAYDPELDRVVLVPATSEETSDDTWLYDYNTDTWEVRPTPAGPLHRDHGAMVYADSIDRMILFGAGPLVGPASWITYPQHDTWTYDCADNTWSLLEPTEFPSERAAHAMAYSPVADKVVLFGGGPDETLWFMDTWLYDPGTNTWTQVGP